VSSDIGDQTPPIPPRLLHSTRNDSRETKCHCEEAASAADVAILVGIFSFKTQISARGKANRMVESSRGDE